MLFDFKFIKKISGHVSSYLNHDFENDDKKVLSKKSIKNIKVSKTIINSHIRFNKVFFYSKIPAKLSWKKLRKNTRGDVFNDKKL